MGGGCLGSGIDPLNPDALNSLTLMGMYTSSSSIDKQKVFVRLYFVAVIGKKN